MKALSIRQPWAFLIVKGFKDVENRNWYSIKHRGLTLIHASKTFDMEGYYWINDNFPLIAIPNDLDKGGIVGAANLLSCVTEHSSKWFFGKYGYVFKDAYELPFMACRGRLGFFEVEYIGG